MGETIEKGSLSLVKIAKNKIAGEFVAMKIIVKKTNIRKK
jgi:hypothetical protein